jgi:hypothetical protein
LQKHLAATAVRRGGRGKTKCKYYSFFSWIAVCDVESNWIAPRSPRIHRGRREELLPACLLTQV